MRNNIVQGSDSSEAEVFDLIKRIERVWKIRYEPSPDSGRRVVPDGQGNFGAAESPPTDVAGIPQLGKTPLLHDMRESAVPGVGDRKVAPGFI